MSTAFEFPVTDDLNIPMTPEEYPEQALPLPPLPGIYQFVVAKSGWRTDKDGNLVLRDDKFPFYTLKSLKIVAPAELEGKGVGLLQDVSTKRGVRKIGGRELPFSEFNDLLRAFDARVDYSDFTQNRELLDRYIGENTTFFGELTWEATDRDYVDQKFAEAGGKDALTKEAQNAIWNTARKNARDFVIGGVRVGSITGPSGELLEARPKIRRFIASHLWTGSEWKVNEPKLGPSGK